MLFFFACTTTASGYKQLTVNPRLRLFTALINAIYENNFIWLMLENQFNKDLCTSHDLSSTLIHCLQMAQRPRLSSMSDHSSPSSDTSENSESFDVPDLRLDTLNLETSLSSEVTENERQQIESFFAGLGTEVSIRLNRRTYRHCADRKWSRLTFFAYSNHVNGFSVLCTL